MRDLRNAAARLKDARCWPATPAPLDVTCRKDLLPWQPVPVGARRWQALGSNLATLRVDEFAQRVDMDALLRWCDDHAQLTHARVLSILDTVVVAACGAVHAQLRPCVLVARATWRDIGTVYFVSVGTNWATIRLVRTVDDARSRRPEHGARYCLRQLGGVFASTGLGWGSREPPTSLDITLLVSWRGLCRPCATNAQLLVTGLAERGIVNREQTRVHVAPSLHLWQGWLEPSI